MEAPRWAPGPFAWTPRRIQKRYFYRQVSSQSSILTSRTLLLSTGVEPESPKSISLRTLPPKSFAFQNPLPKNTIFLLILSTGVAPESPKSISLRTLPPKSFALQNPLLKNTIFLLILSTGVAPESPKSISLRTLPPKSFVWVSDKIWNSKHKTKKQLHPQYFLEHGHV